MSGKMEGYKRDGEERRRGGKGGREGEGEAGFPSTDADTPAREAVMRY